MKMIESLTDNLIRKGHIPQEDRDIYLYGFDITFYTIWSTVALLLIGLALQQFWAAVIIVSLFYTFQSTGGGYHAKSHLACLLTMILGLLAGLGFVFFRKWTFVLWVFFGIGSVLLFSFPLVLHPNKSFLNAKRGPLTIRSEITTLFLMSCVIALNIYWNRYLHSFSAAFLLSGLSRIAGKIIYDREVIPNKMKHWI